MIVGYFIIFFVGIGLFFLMAKYILWLRFIVSVLVVIILFIFFTLFVIKMAARPMAGKTYTLEQWKIENKHKP